jgi:hypothetical protein
MNRMQTCGADRRWQQGVLAVLATLAVASAGAAGCRERAGVRSGPAWDGGGRGDGAAGAAAPTVVLFLVDGMMPAALDTAVAAGATNFGQLLANGVRVATSRSTSPAAVIELPDGAPGGTMPWGHATSGNVAVHTGCHLFEAGEAQMDDIFQAARDQGIKSVFSGGDANYAIFTTADFHTGAMMDDATTVQHAIDRVKKDGVRLVRLHLQRVRDFWTGPADATNPRSAYVGHLLEVDALLGRLVDALDEIGAWPNTYLIVAADHGMGDAASSTHPAATPSSWNPFLAFYGPGLKRGATIPYAELPDVAVTVARFLGARPLRGHLGPAAAPPVPGPTGTVLTNLFAEEPDALDHPRYIERCLTLGAACTSGGDDFAPYRETMLSLIR